MTEDGDIVVASSTAHFEAAHRLFIEYAEEISLTVCYPHPPESAEQIRETYEAPGCGLLLLRVGDAFVGCAGYRVVEGTTCEIKRVYIRADARGMSLGRELAKALIDRARTDGYRRMVLSSLPSMHTAQALYRSLGFADSEPFGVPIEGALYMAMAL